jgi:predicted MFS family arabinose efflux permease
VRSEAASLALAAAVAFALADSSIVVLALPELYGDFDTTVQGVSWVITAYNLAVVAGAVAVLPLAGRVRPAVSALAGLCVFAAASIVCAAAGGLAMLIAGRTIQGLGAALLLVSSLPLLSALAGPRERAVSIWVAAGTLGAAAGPAVGGILTELFSWRAIFAVQAPVAALALLAARERRARSVAPAGPALERPRFAAGVGLALAFAALVGALFLAVLLLVTVWDLGPLAGAAVVSVLPLAAVASRPLARRLSRPVEIAGGAVLLAAGLVALAFLPASSVAYAVPALAVSGVGLGLALVPLTSASIAERGDLERSASFSVGVRHLGLVIGLVAVAPLLAGTLDRAGDDATTSATRVVLAAPIPLRTKIPIALDLYRAFKRARAGEIPDLAAPFNAHGAGDDPNVGRARDDLLDAVRAPLTRAFRSSFLLSAAFALLAGLVAPAFRGRAE